MNYIVRCKWDPLCMYSLNLFESSPLEYFTFLVFSCYSHSQEKIHLLLLTFQEVCELENM